MTQPAQLCLFETRFYPQASKTSLASTFECLGNAGENLHQILQVSPSAEFLVPANTSSFNKVMWDVQPVSHPRKEPLCPTWSGLPQLTVLEHSEICCLMEERIVPKLPYAILLQGFSFRSMGHEAEH